MCPVINYIHSLDEKSPVFIVLIHRSLKILWEFNALNFQGGGGSRSENNLNGSV